MRIIVSGTANTGKSTFVKDFIEKYPNYRQSTFDYRKLLGDPSTHSKNTTAELQVAIMNGMIEEISQWKKEDDIIMDRGPIDALVYSMWAFEKGKEGMDDAFITEMMHAHAMVSNMIDVQIFVPYTGEVTIIEDGKREVDLLYIKEIDNLFGMFLRSAQREGKSPIYFPGRIPGLFEVFGSREERIKICELYFDDSGNIGSPDDRNREIFVDDKRGDMFLDDLDEAGKMARAKLHQERQREEFFSSIYKQCNGGRSLRR